MVLNSKVMLIIFLACGFLLMHCQPKQATEVADKETISAVSAARARAFNEGNAAGIAIHFTDSARLMPPGSPTLIGKDEVQKYYQSIFDQYITELESGYLEVEVSGDMAYGRGLAKVTLYDKSTGDTTYAESEYINILKRQSDGTWKTTHDIWNSSE